MKLLNMNANDSIEYFFNVSHPSKNTTENINDVKRYMKFMRTRELNENSANINAHLTEQWYQSIEKNGLKPDYSIYNDPNYYKGVLACFLVYSKEYIKRLARVNKTTGISEVEIMKNLGVETILDLGNGCGYSTICLKELFPKCSVYGTQVKDSDQWDINLVNSEIHDYTVIEDISELNSADVIFASEYFEHIQTPMEHLEDITKLNPKVLIVANSFNKDEAGHFREYSHNNEMFPENKMNIRFNKHLISLGYKRPNRRFWNNTPQIFYRSDLKVNQD